MEIDVSKIINIKTRSEFRDWLTNFSNKEKECYVHVKRGNPVDPNKFYYLDAVEEAICFGWIDSVYVSYNGKRYQRFSPRRKNGQWTELNKERARRLIKLGLMNKEGKKTLPKLGVRSFKIPLDIERILKEHRVWSNFKKFPPLYQRVRVSNILFYKRRDPSAYKKMLNHLIKETKKGEMFGEWNDYGRLLNY